MTFPMRQPWNIARAATFGYLIAGAAFSVASPAEAPDSEWTPPNELTSPDGRYSVRITDKKPSGRDKLFDHALTLYERDRKLSEFSTLGYLLDAHWSPGGHFVAVNNRQGNSGDRIWVFSLIDGRAIKRPDYNYKTKADVIDRDLVQRVRRAFPDYVGKELDRDHVFAAGWEDDTHLRVEISARFFKASRTVSVKDVYRVEMNGLMRVGERISLEDLEAD